MLIAKDRTIYCEQGSKEWFDARMCCVTASVVGAAIAKLKRKDGEAAKRNDLRNELVGQKLTGKLQPHFVSQWMEEGSEKEPLARVEYEMRFGVNVEQVGFIYHPTIKFSGGSPDGLVGADGIVEIKCPMLNTHIETLKTESIPDKYLPQMLWQLACCDDRDWIDFVSFHPDCPDPDQLFTKRLERTPEVCAVIRGMEAEVIQFLAEVDADLETIKSRRVACTAQ